LFDCQSGKVANNGYSFNIVREMQKKERNKFKQGWDFKTVSLPFRRLPSSATAAADDDHDDSLNISRA
jgi:hypothetical protein